MQDNSENKNYRVLKELKLYKARHLEKATLFGLNSVADGNGGFFVYDSKSLKADDGINIIAPEGEPIGRWLRFSSFPPIQNTANPYLTEAAMYADQVNQLQGYIYYVTSLGHFEYLGTTGGTSADYRIIGNSPPGISGAHQLEYKDYLFSDRPFAQNEIFTLVTAAPGEVVVPVKIAVFQNITTPYDNFPSFDVAYDNFTKTLMTIANLGATGYKMTVRDFDFQDYVNPTNKIQIKQTATASTTAVGDIEFRLTYYRITPFTIEN